MCKNGEDPPDGMKSLDWHKFRLHDNCLIAIDHSIQGFYICMHNLNNAKQQHM